MPRKPKNKEIIPPDVPPEEPPKYGQTVITDKLQMELKALADAVRLLSSGWKQDGNTFVREPSKDPVGMDWEKIAPDIRALFCINLLKTFSDAAIRTQYGQKALAMLREVQDQTKIETQKLLDFLAEIEPGKAGANVDTETDSPPLELNGKRLIEPLPVAPFHGLEKLKIAMSKPAQKAKQISEANGTAAIEVVRKRPKVLVSVEIPQGMLTTYRRITQYERAVEDALGSLWAAGIWKVTPRTVYLTMNGIQDPNTFVMPECIQKVDNAIYRLSKTWGDIRFPKEVSELFKIDKAELKKLEGNIVMADRVTLEYDNGQTAEGWLMSKRRPPLFFLCSQLMRQVRTIPSECMNVKYIASNGKERTRKNTENFIAMKHYLVTQIKRIERKDEDDIKRILLKSVIDELDLDPAKREENPRPMTRAEKKRVVEDVTVILEHFKRTDLIAGYRIKKTGNEITGFDIEPRKRR